MLVQSTGTIVNGKRVEVDFTDSWLASAVVNTTKTRTFRKSANQSVPKEHEIIVSNPSTISALNVDIGNIEPNMGFNTATDSLKTVLTTISVPASTAAVIEDCEDAWNERSVAEVTATASTTAAALAVGTNSAKFAIGANFTTGIVGSEAFGSALNLSKYTHIYAFVYSTVALDAGDMQLLLDNTAECASPLETINLPAIPANTLTRVRLPLVNPDSDLAIISIGLRLTVDKGAMDFHIDDVNAVKMSNVSTLVQGWRNGVDGFIRMDNATVLTAIGAFSTKVRVKELG
jgi:hypothetical protein